jgi:hypothetical protein
MSKVVELVEEREIVPGNLYYDLDGSLVQLLGVDGGLCRWVLISKTPQGVQTTHLENFRRRFRTREQGRKAQLRVPA